MSEKKEEKNKQTNGVQELVLNEEEQKGRDFEQREQMYKEATKSYLEHGQVSYTEEYLEATKSYRGYGQSMTDEEFKLWFYAKYSRPAKKTSAERAADKAFWDEMSHVRQLDDELYFTSSVESADKIYRDENHEREASAKILKKMDKDIAESKDKEDIKYLERLKKLKELLIKRSEVAETFWSIRRYNKVYLTPDERNKLSAKKIEIAKNIVESDDIEDEIYLKKLMKTPPPDAEKKEKKKYAREKKAKYSNEKYRRPLPTTPLHSAIQRGAVDEVKSLIEQGADVEARLNDRLRRTPLAVAADRNLPDMVNSLKIMEYLIQVKADIEAPLLDSHTVLYHCMRQGFLDPCRLLVTHGAKFYSEMRDLAFNWDNEEMRVFCNLGEIVNFNSIRQYYLDEMQNRFIMKILLPLIPVNTLASIILSYIPTGNYMSLNGHLALKAQTGVNIIKAILLKVFEGEAASAYQESISKIKTVKEVEDFLQKGEDTPGFPREIQKLPELMTLQKDWKGLTTELAKLESHEEWEWGTKLYLKFFCKELTPVKSQEERLKKSKEPLKKVKDSSKFFEEMSEFYMFDNILLTPSGNYLSQKEDDEDEIDHELPSFGEVKF